MRMSMPNRRPAEMDQLLIVRLRAPCYILYVSSQHSAFSSQKRQGFILSVLLLLAATCLAADHGRGQLLYITVHSSALEHNRVGDSPDRDVSIYLPPGYDSGTRRYPVLYLLHGYTGNDRGWMTPNYV